MHPIKTGKISDNLYAVRTITVNFFIYACDAGLLCFDAGYAENLARRQLSSLGISPASISHVFLTHTDFDHASGAALFENAQVYLSSAEEQLINGEKARLLGYYYNTGIKPGYHLLDDNEVVRLGSTSIRAIATPGHTAGSMSYLVDESVLFVGDTFKLVNDRVRSLRAFMNMDTERQKQSIRKLARLKEVQIACTGHTGYTRDFNLAMSNWK